MAIKGTLEEVIAIVQKLCPSGSAPVTGTTLILTELDFDSLKMIELIDALKDRYGIDFYAPPQNLSDLSSSETIVAALERAHAS